MVCCAYDCNSYKALKNCLADTSKFIKPFYQMTPPFTGQTTKYIFHSDLMPKSYITYSTLFIACQITKVKKMELQTRLG